MDCDTTGGISICGNFAERSESKPDDFDYMTTGKWYEPYPFDWRETMGGTICNCKRVKVNFAPYYGFDFMHLESCNLMRKIHNEPQILNLIETHLPAITHYTDSVPDKKRIPLYITGLRKTRAFNVRVKAYPPQGVLF